MAMDGIEGLLIDLDGVLYVGDEAIAGARETLGELRGRGIDCRFVTNTTTRTAAEVVDKLERLGFEVAADEVFSAVTATREFLQAKGRPKLHLIVRDSVRPEFEDFPQDDEQPDFVVVGDIGAAWSYPLMNAAFRQLMDGAELVAMHANRFFQTAEGLMLDIGAFVAGLEAVTGKQATVVGKPSCDFFQLGLDSLALAPERVAMVGDDIESDVGGGQRAGLRGVLVRTGKFREEQARESEVEPDAVIDSIADLPGLLG